LKVYPLFNPYKFSGHITGYCLALHQGKTIGIRKKSVEFWGSSGDRQLNYLDQLYSQVSFPANGVAGEGIDIESLAGLDSLFDDVKR